MPCPIAGWPGVLARVFLLPLALALASGASRAEGERIAIPATGPSTSAIPLVGFLFKPEGRAPHPAVVMMHGCGGAYSRDGSLNARHLMWGEFLASHGYLALMLDSFSSRGVKELCTQKFADRTLKEADRVGDAYAALAFLRARPDVDGELVSLLGWSHGGGSVLATIGKPPPRGPGFAAAVAFYPGCTARAKAPQDFHPHAPLLVLIGESDDWTPADACKALAAAVAARGEPMRIVTYPDAFHDFDNPGITKRRVRKEVPNGVHPGEGVTIAPDPQAREDAKQRVLQFLAEQRGAAPGKP
jgi:dienelactone hydrolase